MVFEIRPYPEFSWSLSRQRLLERCARAYFCRYYLSHNGWLSEAPARSQLAYRLAKLTSLDAVLGQEMNGRAREIESEARAGRSLPSRDELEARTRAGLRAAWRSSRDGIDAFERRPKDVPVMLRSFYVEGSPPSADEVARVEGKILPCLEGLLSASHWVRVRECGVEGCVTIPDFDHFFRNGLKIFAAADFAYVYGGELHVVEWKSGREEDDHESQVLASAFGLSVSQPPLAGVRAHGHLHYLSTADEREIEIPDDLEDQVVGLIKSGVAQMRAYLRDPALNAPLEEHEFNRVESGLCRNCNFTQLCSGT